MLWCVDMNSIKRIIIGITQEKQLSLDVRAKGASLAVRRLIGGFHSRNHPRTGLQRIYGVIGMPTGVDLLLAVQHVVIITQVKEISSFCVLSSSWRPENLIDLKH